MSGRFYTALMRVVTGYDANGAPTILWQGEPPTVIHAGRYTTTELWVSDRAPIEATPADASVAEWALEPPPGGACFRIVEIAPDAEAKGVDGDGGDDSDGDFQGTHATDTLDYVTILSGEVTLVVGGTAVSGTTVSGAVTGYTEVLLKAGDSVVQQPGVPHDWQNRSGEAAVMIGVLLSAR
jgi:mannose-6-phosphate isomerase-like protein (cupin superfamily)